MPSPPGADIFAGAVKLSNCCGCAYSNTGEYADQLDHLFWRKHSFNALWTKVCEWRSVQLTSAHPACVKLSITRLTNWMVCGESLSSKESVKRAFCGLPVQTND